MSVFGETRALAFSRFPASGTSWLNPHVTGLSAAWPCGWIIGPRDPCLTP